MKIPSTDRRRIVILGGGFAGLHLAKSLGSSSFQVVLVDQHNYHNFQPLLYQIATAGLMPDSIVAPFRNIFSSYKNVIFRLGTATGIDSEANVVHTDKGSISYDNLVIATGADTNFFNMERVKQAAFPLKTIPDALEIRSTLLQIFERAVTNQDPEKEADIHIVIVGGGPTGIEMAGAIAELRANEIRKDYPDLPTDRIRIWLVELATELISAMSDHASSKSLSYLNQLGVEVLLGTAIEDYADGKVILSNGQQIPTNLLIYAAGVVGTAPGGLELAIWEKGHRLQIDRHCRVLPYNNIYAIGDIAAMTTNGDMPLPMLAQPAIQQGKYLAKYFKSNCDPAMAGFNYRDLGAMATIGKRKAVADLSFGKFHGTFAWFLWLFVHVMGLVGFRNRLSVILSWSLSYFAAHKNYRLIIRPSEKLSL